MPLTEVYIYSVALCWLWLVNGIRPSLWDVFGVFVCLIGMAIIMFAPRHALNLQEAIIDGSIYSCPNKGEASEGS